jgi:hypothetical protein
LALMGTEWFTGSAIPAPRGSDQEAANARLGTARVVRRAALREQCPPPPLHEVGPNRPPPALKRHMLTQDGQWLAWLFDYLGLWPAIDRNPDRTGAVRDCGPMSKRPRRSGE